MSTRDVKLSFANNSIKKFTLWIFTFYVTVLTSSEENDPYMVFDLLIHAYIHIYMHDIMGAGIAQWLECQTRDWKVAGSNPCRNSRIFFSRVNFLCWLLFRYPFHPRVTAVARERARSFCQKCRWQVTAKHAYTLRMWLCMKWHGAWLYTEPARRQLQFHVALAMPAL